MITIFVNPGDKVEPWDMLKQYRPGSRCTHGGRLWQAGIAGTWQGIEPDDTCWEGYWKEVPPEASEQAA